jgi:hypothetical protein
MDKDKLMQKYKNMKQFKDLPIEELELLVDKKIQEEELLTTFVGLSDEEIKKAIKLYDQYITEHSFESLAEKSTLINLIRDELLKERVLTQIKTEYDNKSNANSMKLFEELRELEEHILLQKEKLGMMKDKNSESALDLMSELKEKALAYYNEHAGETFVKCPECQSLFRLLMKIDGLEPAKATFFRGTTLYNQKLMELYHYKKVTKFEVAEILGVNEKYIEFIYNNIYLKKSDEENK